MILYAGSELWNVVLFVCFVCMFLILILILPDYSYFGSRKREVKACLAVVCSPESNNRQKEAAAEKLIKKYITDRTYRKRILDAISTYMSEKWTDTALEVAYSKKNVKEPVA